MTPSPEGVVYTTSGRDENWGSFLQIRRRRIEFNERFLTAAYINAQAAIDAARQIIVAADVTQSAADVRQLVPMIDQVEQNTGLAPAQVLADAGCRSVDNFRKMEKREIDACCQGSMSARFRG